MDKLILPAMLSAAMSFSPILNQGLAKNVYDRHTRGVDTVQWAEADTGRMMPAYRDLHGYNTPAMCIAAVQRAESLYWRRGEGDYLPKSTPYDTLPRYARDVGNRCLLQFNVVTVGEEDLEDFVRLAIIIGDTSKARSGIERYLSIYQDDSVEQAIFLNAAARYIAGKRPVDINFARSLIQYVDGTTASVSADSVFSQLLHVYTLNNDPISRNEVFNENIAYLERRYPDDQRRLMSFIYKDSFEFPRVPSGMYTPDDIDEIYRLGNIWKEWTFDESSPSYQRVMGELTVETMADRASFFGTKAPDLKVFKVFPENEGKEPLQGRVTMYMPAFSLGSPIGLGRFSGKMESYLAMLKRLHEKYYNAGLDIVLVTKTNGYAWDSPPLDPEEEAKVIAWYYRDYLKLPFRIMVEKTEFVRVPDGRLISLSGGRPDFMTSHFIGKRRSYLNLGTGYIVGRNGTVVSYFTRSSASGEPLADAIVKRHVEAELEKAVADR